MEDMRLQSACMGLSLTKHIGYRSAVQIAIGWRLEKDNNPRCGVIFMGRMVLEDRDAVQFPTISLRIFTYCFLYLLSPSF